VDFTLYALPQNTVLYSCENLESVKHTFSATAVEYNLCFSDNSPIHMHLKHSVKPSRKISFSASPAITEDRHRDLAKQSQFDNVASVIEGLESRIVTIVHEVDDAKSREQELAMDAERTGRHLIIFGLLASFLVIASGLYNAHFLFQLLRQRKIV